MGPPSAAQRDLVGQLEHRSGRVSQDELQALGRDRGERPTTRDATAARHRRRSRAVGHPSLRAAPWCSRAGRVSGHRCRDVGKGPSRPCSRTDQRRDGHAHLDAWCRILSGPVSDAATRPQRHWRPDRQAAHVPRRLPRPKRGSLLFGRVSLARTSARLPTRRTRADRGLFDAREAVGRHFAFNWASTLANVLTPQCST
jgi:hypothetical protein